MKGVILDFSVQHNAGVISGDDQNRYNFNGSDWRGQNSPQRGDKVDFGIGTEGQATDIYIALGDTNNPIQNLSAQLDKISNQNQAEENFNIIDWLVKGLKNYANFKGRARRKEYWFFVLSQFIVIIVATILDSILFGNPALFYTVVALGLFIPSLAVAVRRMHDIGKSGWLLLISIIPLIGLIVIFWLATETKQEINQWGQPAK